MKEQEDDLLVYDEDEAVKFILESLPADAKTRIDEDKIEYVLDVPLHITLFPEMAPGCAVIEFTFTVKL